MQPRTTFALGGADRFEAEALRNEGRIRRMLGSSGGLGPLSATAAGPVARRSPLEPTASQKRDAIVPSSGGRSPGRVRIRKLRLLCQDLWAGAIQRKELGASRVDAAFPLARAKGGGPGLSASIARSTGVGLPKHVRALLEPAFGQSFGDVRIHVDANASMASAAVRAEAFTLGRDIYFNRGFYDPSTPRGIALIGHELTHVVQNRGGTKGLLQRKPTVAQQVEEQEKAEARRFADEIDAAVARYKKEVGKVDFDDPQSHGLTLALNAYSKGHFNVTKDAAKAQEQLNDWFLAVQDKGQQIPERDVLFRAMQLNGGNVPLAMGTIASYFHDTREAASWVKGLGNNHKRDYYRYAGAFIGLQGAGTKQAGQAFAKVDIVGTWANAFFVHGNPYIDETGSKLFQTNVGQRAVDLIQRRALGIGGNAFLYAEQARAKELSLASGTSSGGLIRRKSGVADAMRLWRDIGGAVDEYGGAVTFDDPQDFYSKEFFDRTGGAEFNHAPGGVDATQNTEKWLKEQMSRWGGTRQQDLILEALKENKGNLTLAMGSLAEILCKSENRALAAHIVGLQNDGKDYYRYAGAYVGLHDTGVRALGALGSHANILGNPFGYLFGGLYLAGSSAVDRKWQGVKENLALSVSRFDGEGIKNKLYEFNLGLTVAETWRSRRAGALGTAVDSLDEIWESIKPKSFVVAGEDTFERQAMANEKVIRRALEGRGGIGHLGASVEASANQTIRRKGWFSDWLQGNKEFWDEVGTQGVTEGGVWGNTKAVFAAFASSVNDPGYVYKQTKAYAVGFGEGAWDGAKGFVNMVVHPIQTATGVYNLVVHWDQVGPVMAEKIKTILDHATSDPELFAREMGQLAGQIDVALIGPKAIGGVKEVTGALKTLKGMTPLGRTLFHYSSSEVAALIKSSGRIGAAGRSAFATALHPMLGGSKTLLGILARNIFLGGRLDFVMKAGKFLKVFPKMGVVVKDSFTVATEFSGGAFKPILLTHVETAVLRAAKTISGFQYAAETQQQVTVLAQHLLANPVTRTALFEAADMAGSGAAYVMIDGVAVKADAIDSVDWENVKPDPHLRDKLLGPQRKKRGTSRYADEDPEVARLFHDVVDRYGHEPGVSLDFTTKSRLERFLGRELGDVRLHTGPLAREVARATEAEAITFGRDIYLPSERLGAASGLDLLAHEATHVAQAAPATPVSSPRSLGAGASVEVMEDVARSIEARFASASRAPSYPVLAEPAVREAPVAPAAAAASVAAGPGSPALEVAAPAPSVGSSAPSRRAVGDVEGGQTPGFDPVGEVMRSFHVPPSVSQEEFLEICTERLVELMKDELAGDEDRRESLAWNYDLPNA